MINPFTQINWNPSDREVRKFGLTLFIGFVIISILIILISLFRSGYVLWKPVLILDIAGILVFLLAFFAPRLAVPLYYVWFFVSACIGIVVSNLILAMFYYLFFSPFSIAARRFTGRDPLLLRKTQRESYWVGRRNKRSLKSYLKQY